MQPIRSLPLLAACLAISVTAGPASAQVDIRLEPFVEGVNAPVAMVQPPGDDRFFILEQWGRIRIADANGELRGVPFLDIRHKVVDLWPDFDERGLLGIAFHPDFQENGRFFIAYSAPINWQGDVAKLFWWDHTNVIAEYRVFEDDPDAADPSSERIISSVDWPQFNHNGHWIQFGPDGMLYVATGDGGYANDWGIGHNVTEGNGQDLTSIHGKILRIDVDNPEDGRAYGIPDDNPFADDPQALPEIWAYGLRNPWRCSFDMEDGRLFCGDVQQNSYEEVDIIEAGDNLGWREMEATHCFDYTQPDAHPEDACDPSQYVAPILEYPNCTAQPQDCLGISVIGGYVYRGEHADWDGKYIFGDWSKSFADNDGQIFVATQEGDNWTMEQANATDMEGNLPYILAFAQDSNGEVYALTTVTTGPVGSLDTIYRIVPAAGDGQGTAADGAATDTPDAAANGGEGEDPEGGEPSGGEQESGAQQDGAPEGQQQ